MAQTAEQLQSALTQFHGTDTWYRHGVNRNLLYTDGVQYLAEEADAYWLIDEIALRNQFTPQLRREPFQAWSLTLNKTGNGAKLVCNDGNGRIVQRARIPFTDFPLQSITLWCEQSGIEQDDGSIKLQWVLMLPGER